MTTDTTTALGLLRQVLGQFTDAPAEQIVPEAELASLQVDSLTLAEMLFELEDRLGVTMAEPASPPRTVADMLALIEPYLDTIRAKAAA
jgi:acyl carrier protein